MLAVRDTDNRLSSGKNTRRFRRRDAIFGFSAATTAGGVVVSRGDRVWRVGDPALDDELVSALAADVNLAMEDDIPHQDRGGVSIIGQSTLDWCADRWGLDADPRRLRSNVVVSRGEPFLEESWVGCEVQVGDARLRIVERAPRCRMVDVAQDGTSARGALLGPLTAVRGMYLGVYADVVVPGLVKVGDAVTLC